MDRESNRGKEKFHHYRKKLYAMVDEPSTDSIVSWSESGNSFIVWNETEFCRDVLPRFSHYKEMAPFIRRIRMMGFKKIESSEHWEYGKDDFLRGHPDVDLTREQVRARLTEMSSALRKKDTMRARLAEMSSALRKKDTS